MYLKNIVLPAIFALGTAISAQAATLTAVFETTPLIVQEGNSEDINDILTLTVTDLVGGGIEMKLTATGASDGVGSVFIKGFTANQFTGLGNIFDASSANSYSTAIGTPGVVFGEPNGSSSLFASDMAIYNNAMGINLTTADFLGKDIGAISVLATAPDRLGSLFKGEFISDVAPIPLPAAMPLLVFGLGAMGLASRRKRKAS
ncbi:MAG: VPLPA-CTERM sorting domain-containing protein [Sedimentitalea sp.]